MSVAGDGERWLKSSTTGIFVLRGASECAFVELGTQRLRTSFLGRQGAGAESESGMLNEILEINFNLNQSNKRSI